MKPAVVTKKTSPAKQSSKRPNPRGRRQLHPIVQQLAQVPYQKPILKEEYKYRDNYRTRRVDPELGSKYVGVSYDASVNRWRAQMMIDKSVVNLGTYMNEEEAGEIYAKAAFQFKSSRSKLATGIYGGLDLRAVPNQPLILKQNHETSTVKYKGVKAKKNRWQASITRNGGYLHLGTFDTMEKAAQIYSNAVYYLEHKKDFLPCEKDDTERHQKDDTERHQKDDTERHQKDDTERQSSDLEQQHESFRQAVDIVEEYQRCAV
jgi:AP2 domain